MDRLSDRAMRRIFLWWLLAVLVVLPIIRAIELAVTHG